MPIFGSEMLYNHRTNVIIKFLLHRHFLLLVFTLLFIGIFYARIMVSILDVFIFILGLIKIFSSGIRKNDILNKHTIPFILLFFLYFLSFTYSENKHVALSRLSTNNYFLLIPLGISMLQPMCSKLIQNILLSFITISFVSCFIIFIDYLFNINDYNNLYKVGKVIPTPILYIRYSFFVSLALLIGLAQLLTRQFSSTWNKNILLFIVCFLFIFIHVLAVRTGLLTLYVGLFALLIITGKKYFKTRSLIGLGISLVLFIVVSVNTVPTLKNKWHYMRHDVSMYLGEKGHYLYSDNLRIISIKNGIDLLKSNPLFGVGIGDLKAETSILYQQNYPDIPPELRALPINQFVFTFSAFGIIGGLLFFIFLFYPISYNQHCKDPKLIVIYAATVASFLGHASIELQLGKVVFVVLVSLSLWDIYNRKSTENEVLPQ